MLRSNRIAYLGALCFLPLILAVNHADAAPTEEKGDLVAPQKQFVPAQISADDARTIEGFPQPQLVAIHEIAIDYNRAPALVRATYQVRPRILKKGEGGLSKMLTDPIVSPVPPPKSPIYGRYRHTATSDPYVDAHD